MDLATDDGEGEGVVRRERGDNVRGNGSDPSWRSGGSETGVANSQRHEET